ncbi:MAG: DUF512 domain-containing protein [Clostridia bacterium]|nr:DUF512 domain-containing protein [Clostridia bacterium]
MAVVIAHVLPKSIAARKRIAAGDRLLSVNGHTIEDVLDYRFYLSEPRLSLSLQTVTGKTRTVRIRKAEDEDIGLEFETYLMDRQHSCRNNCIFCFIDQMPPGMRETLYFKDDDSRLSFLFGNYITLTNLSEHEIDRIMAMRISPINISVHTTNPELRCRMMNNRFAGDTLSLLKRFADAGIHMDCQLVLCPEWNDGDELLRSMRDLAALAPAVESVAVVPVGLTKYREGLTPLRPFTAEESASVLDMVTRFGDEQEAQTGNRLIYPADEWYVQAGRPIPDETFYGEMSQLENGVGLVALLRSQFADALASHDGREGAGTKTVLATGMAAAPIVTELVNTAASNVRGIAAQVRAIRNDFFGETITVAGLVTGRDLLAQLQGIPCDRVLIPDCMLRHEGDRFLDDVTPQDLENQLGIRVEVIATDGAALFEALLR